MEETNHYYWQKTTKEKLTKSSPKASDLIYFSDLCKSKLQNPRKCTCHVAITYQDFIAKYPNYIGTIFISKTIVDEYDKTLLEYETAKTNYRASKITFKGALLSFLVILIPILLTTINRCGSQAQTSGIKKDSVCDCEFEDISVKKGTKHAKFRVVYLSQEKRWLYESIQFLSDGSDVSTLVTNYLPKIPNFKTSLGIVALGVSSYEGEKETEEDRADKRADAILSGLRTLEMTKDKNLYKLNLGKFMYNENPGPGKTSYQRRVIVIGIMEASKSLSVNQVGEKLQKALQKSDQLSFDVNKYSMYKFEKR